ncbi:42 kDa endochitinase [Fusarium odoratissimum]|uniref:42 kDa endochitinase n=1 Tax=Fusarium oxysporum f. sp. cubense (strain race 4) TaxID=2502994 RepID=N1RJR5_FUSC4|nr:42 kDa endochitinase [Fusarium odoratissimum]
MRPSLPGSSLPPPPLSLYLFPPVQPDGLVLPVLDVPREVYYTSQLHQILWVHKDSGGIGDRFCIPVYARYFGQARGPGHPFKGSGEIDYCDLPDEWVAGAKVEESIAAASFVDTKGDKGFVSFDVPSTVCVKARYAKAMCLGGLFYWTGAGDRAGPESLVAAGWKTLHSK